MLLIVALLLVCVRLLEVSCDSTTLLNILLDTTFLLNLMNIFVSGSCLWLSIMWITKTVKEQYLTVAELQFAFFVLYLSWSQFILTCDKLPVIGLYVVMFRKVLFTFGKVSFFGILLVFTFAVIFMALFKDPRVQVCDQSFVSSYWHIIYYNINLAFSVYRLSTIYNKNDDHDSWRCRIWLNLSPGSIGSKRWGRRNIISTPVQIYLDFFPYYHAYSLC